MCDVVVISLYLDMLQAKCGQSHPRLSEPDRKIFSGRVRGIHRRCKHMYVLRSVWFAFSQIGQCPCESVLYFVVVLDISIDVGVESVSNKLSDLWIASNGPKRGHTPHQDIGKIYDYAALELSVAGTDELVERAFHHPFLLQAVIFRQGGEAAIHVRVEA